MKKIILVTLIGLLFSCEKEQTMNEKKNDVFPVETSEQFSYSESLEKWEQLKSENGNSYTYQTKFKSWSGFSNTTEIRVKNNIVVSRFYEEKNNKEITYSYTEISNEIGTHEQGASPLTIDQLYTTCASEYLQVDTIENKIYFNTGSDGLFTLCGFFPNGCMDDCFQGISIDSFKWMD